MNKRNLIVILLAAAGAFLLFQQQGASSNASPTGGPVSTTLTTDQKRREIISWWDTSTPPATQDADGGRFVDIISNISPAQIDTIYQYVTQYLELRIQPQPGSAIYNAMQTIINQYQIFTT